MVRKLVIRNKSGLELGVMLEPATDREDVSDGGQLAVLGNFTDNSIIIDIQEGNFISIWAPPGAILDMN